MKLSVAIITFNEEDNIARTLKALDGLADELIIIDSFSTDKTCEITESYGAKIFKEKFKGHIEQKNSALDKCQGEWILSIDADEVLSSELKASILKAIDGKVDGYVLKRRTFYMGKLLKYSWQPDRKLRLVRRSASPLWKGYNPHDMLTVEGKTSSLKGELIHYSYKSFADHMQRTVAYASGAAKSYQKRGKKAGFLALLSKPPFAFFKNYILRRAFLDGIQGIMASLSSAFYVYMKYCFLWEYNKLNKTDKSDSI